MMRLLVVLCGVALGAWGAFIDLPAQVFQHAVGNGPERTVTFAPFDDLGGTRRLTGVTLSLEGALSAAATAENLSGLSNTLTLQLFGGNVLASAPGGLATTVSLAFTPVSATVDASDGVAGSGVDFHDFGAVSTTSASATASLTTNLDGFVGPDLVPVVLDAGGTFIVSGTASCAGNITDFTTAGSAALRYTYEPVSTPEPSAVVLLVLGGVVVAGRRSRRREAALAV